MAKFKALGERVAVRLGDDDYIHGDLMVRTDTTAILPQYFAQMENGEMRDLRQEEFTILEDS